MSFPVPIAYETAKVIYNNTDEYSFPPVASGNGESDSESAYDGVIFVNFNEDEVFECQLISGTYSSVRSKLENKEPVSILVNFYRESTGVTCAANATRIKLFEGEIQINFWSNAVWNNAAVQFYSTLVWLEDDTIDEESQLHD